MLSISFRVCLSVLITNLGDCHASLGRPPRPFQQQCIPEDEPTAVFLAGAPPPRTWRSFLGFDDRKHCFHKYVWIFMYMSQSFIFFFFFHFSQVELGFELLPQSTWELGRDLNKIISKNPVAQIVPESRWRRCPL